MNFTGYDKAALINTLNSIEMSYKSIHRALDSYIQTGFIGGMSSVWACKEAQDFFTKVVKPQFDEIIKTLNNNFTSISRGINAAARVWSMTVQDSWINKEITPISKSIDVTMIAENLNGIRGINKEAAASVSEKLTTFDNMVTGYLEDAVRSVDTLGFLGGEQQQKLKEALSSNKTIIKDYVLAVSVALKKAIEETITSYGQLETKVSEAFSGEIV